jgi:AbrB family looped-hinge helix DNA binding protein
MITTIDSAGRLVVPKEIRQLAGLKPGIPLEVSWKDGCIEIEPAPLSVQLKKKGRLTVAVPQTEVGLLRSSTVEQTREWLQQERGSAK